MVRKSMGVVLNILGALAVVYGVYRFVDSFLPRVALEQRGWWAVLATLIVGPVLAWSYVRRWPEHSFVVTVRALGECGWVVLYLCQGALGIESHFADFFLVIPFIALTFWRWGDMRRYGFNETRFDKNMRVDSIVLATCTVLVILSTLYRVPLSAMAFLVLLFIVQAAGTAFPDVVRPNPKWRPDPDAESAPATGAG